MLIYNCLMRSFKFKFPREQDKPFLDSFYSRDELKRSLKSLIKKEFSQNPFSYNIYSKPGNDNRIFCYCNKCRGTRAKLIYEYRENLWTLRSYIDEHDHT